MADPVYQVGDLVSLDATFTDQNGVPTDTTVTLTVREPDGTVITPTPTHTATGVYHYGLSADQTGLYWYTFKGAGAVTAASNGSFLVKEDWVTSGGPLSSKALVALDEAREYVLRDATDDSQDAKLVRRINAFSAAVWQYTEREWTTTANATRKFMYQAGGYTYGSTGPYLGSGGYTSGYVGSAYASSPNFIDLKPYDLQAVTEIVAFTDLPTVSQVTLTAPSSTVQGDYTLRPYGGDPATGTYRWIALQVSLWTVRYWPGTFEIAVTGDWGIPTVPDDVKEAVLIAVDNSFYSPEGAASSSYGGLAITEQVEQPFETWRALPPASRALLTPYREAAGSFIA